MLNLIRSPLLRISLGLVLVTIAALLLSDMLGLMPDTKRAKFNSRKAIAESLAVQFSIDIANDQLDTVQETLKVLIRRNEDVQSAAIRRKSGDLIAEFGGHREFWSLEVGDKSTPNQIQVPLFDKQGLWGTVELSFVDIAAGGGFSLRNSFPAVIALVALCGFIGYWIFLKRALRELDPSAVIPERVRLALDTLAEGLIIVDLDNTIVFANRAFANKASMTTSALVGRSVKSLPWQSDNEELPWNDVLHGHETPSGETHTISLSSSLNRVYKFVLNFSPIVSDTGDVRGAMITFDDVTEVERKNVELQNALVKLEQGQREIARQNKALHALATRDPLTNLLNRRSLTDAFDSMVQDAVQHREHLACLVVDIDHFKSVNDEFGHSVGDIVIRSVATVLTKLSRSNDIVGRFGGEEFCIVLPETDSLSAFRIAERIRVAMEGREVAELEKKRNVTISIGVTDISQGATTVAEMFDQADKALYFAKESGRNRVVRWPIEAEEDGGLQLSDLEKELAAQIASDAAAADTIGSNEEVARNLEDEVEAGAESSDHRTDHMDINRALLIDRIEQAVLRSERNNTTLAVAALEFDITQEIDAEMSAALADTLEKTLTQRLKAGLRSTDTVIISEEDEELLFSVLRTGTREVIVLLPDLQDFNIVPVILGRLFTATKAPIVANGMEFYVDVDVGVSLYPLDSDESDTLLSNARSAMREAKRIAGSNNWVFYSAEINDASKRQRRLGAELPAALERGEFVALYQPKVCLKRGNIIGFEALLRWESSELGLVLPGEFIPLAEQSDLIDQITLRLVTTACDQISAWKNEGFGDLSVAVNLSPIQFRNPEIARQIISLVNESNIPASSIEFEITESVMVQNMKTAIGILTQLSTAGFSIAIDDFGVGYSTFSYLSNFPVDCVKIDRSFLADLKSGSTAAAIISATIALAQSLGLNVVAEGVETEEQLRFLQDLGCNMAQGHLMSKPIPADEVSKLLARPTSIRRLILKHDQAGERSRESSASAFGIINKFAREKTEPPKLVVVNSDVKKKRSPSKIPNKAAD